VNDVTVCHLSQKMMLVHTVVTPTVFSVTDITADRIAEATPEQVEMLNQTITGLRSRLSNERETNDRLIRTINSIIGHLAQNEVIADDDMELIGSEAESLVRTLIDLGIIANPFYREVTVKGDYEVKGEYEVTVRVPCSLTDMEVEVAVYKAMCFVDLETDPVTCELDEINGHDVEITDSGQTAENTDWDSFRTV